MRYLIEFSGEHKTLPFAEINAVLETYFDKYESELQSPGVGIIKTLKSFEKLIDRLSLCRSISKLYFTLSSPSYASVLKKVRSDIKRQKGTFTVDARRVLGHHRSLSLTKLKKVVGTAVVSSSSGSAKVDMENPDIVIKLLLSKNLYLGELIDIIDRKRIEYHHNRNRPFFSPISLHPKYARAMINLARIKEGMRLFDPFCGTGGILIEGSHMGLKSYGSDISEKMINGSKKNLEFFNLDYSDIIQSDIEDCSKIFDKMDAIVTDPPYGRSASTSGENLNQLYHRSFASMKDMLKKNRFLVIILPNEDFIELGKKYLDLKESYSVYVHRSLTRYICVYQN